MPTQNKKGSIAIIVVLGTTLTLTLAVMTLYVLVNAKLTSLKSNKEKFIAYYLCETGISGAMYDLANGTKRTETNNNFDYTIGDKTYKIHYDITKIAANYEIIGSTTINNKTYYLKAGGKRAFPIFIKGYAGGK